MIKNRLLSFSIPAGLGFLLLVSLTAILYFGAEFTKAYAMKYGSEIRPDNYAVTIQVVNVESSEASVQQNERECKICRNGISKTTGQQ